MCCDLHLVCSARKANKAHDTFDSDIIKNWRKPVLRSCAVSLADVGNRSHRGLTAAVGFYFASNRGRPELGRSPRRRIFGKRLSNTSSGLKTGWIKNAVTLILRNYHGGCKSCPRQRARGLWLVASVPRDFKNAEVCPKDATVQATVNPKGFAVCNRVEPKMLSIQI